MKANAYELSTARLTDDELVSEMMYVPHMCLPLSFVYFYRRTLLLAGHETTSSTMTWALYELAQNPSVQEEIRQEILEHRSRNSEAFSVSELDAMPFLNAFVKVFQLSASITSFSCSSRKYFASIPSRTIFNASWTVTMSSHSLLPLSLLLERPSLKYRCKKVKDS